MSLSCGCGEDFRDGDWWWQIEHSPEFIPLLTKRWRKCCSCGKHVTPGDDVVEVYRYRQANTDIEERFHGGEVPLASWWLCEECGGLAMAINDLGMCYELGPNSQSLKKQIADYREEERAFKERANK